MERLKSRKLVVVLASLATLVASAWAGVLPVHDAIANGVELVMVYVGAQGAVDLAAAFRAPKS